MRKSWTEQEVEIIKTMYPDNLTENPPFYLDLLVK
jgi:hypothetical protein